MVLVFVVGLLFYLTHAAPDARFKLTPGHYNTAGGPKDGVLNVHVVPHTHDDVGWLKTVDEYFMGANNSIQNAGVQYILDSAIAALAADPHRKFIYVEIAFFKRWWDEQSDQIKDLTRNLVNRGQLEFINGGWCMSDEAAPYYVDMVDQQTLGHQFLLHEFGPAGIPKTGWQIDPFGHSSFMGTLYALMGFNSWFFGRIDYQDMTVRESNLTLEMVMRPSPSLGSAVNIFTGVMHGYGPPRGFNFNLGSGDAPIQDDPRLEGVNVADRVDQFVSECLAQASQYQTNNIMLTMGSDFQYLNANTWFKNLDKLIHYTNVDGRINAFYSTPTMYTNSKFEANFTWPVKDDDFFPYADHPHAFWTGYFTSRPALKGYVRSRSNYLQACRQLELQVNASGSSELLWEAMGLAQHHDAVSGTEKQHVADDYARHLSEGTAECRTVVNSALAVLMGDKSLKFTDCPFLNESICESTSTGQNAVVVSYNPMGRTRNQWIRLPVPVKRQVTVFDESGKNITTSIVPIPGQSDLQTVIYRVTIPPLGHTTSFLVFSNMNTESTVKPEEPTGPIVTIENDIYRISFDSSSGLAQTVIDLRTGVSTKYTHNWGWYNASTGNVAADQNPGQASGAYIFRPNCTENVPTPCKPFAVSEGRVQLSFSRSAQVQEAYQVFSPWVSNTIRLYEGAEFIEVEYTVGPIPFQDGLGREVVSIWQTDLQTNNIWYTDSNGRDMQKRQLNYRPTWKLDVTDPVSGNYYPVDSSICLKEGTSRQLTVITDRAQGGASLAGGEVELMVHRRLLHDDRRGVNEPLNETGVNGDGLIVTGYHRVMISNGSIASELHRSEEEHLTFPAILTFAPLTTSVQQFISSHKTTSQCLKSSLPDNVHLLTSMDNSNYGKQGSMILRLSHLYAVGEDPVLSTPATVVLDELFSQITISNCVEMSITANQKRADVHRYVWNTADGVPSKTTANKSGAGLTVVIEPLEIRTWSCDYVRN